MAITIYALTIETFVPVLTTLSGLLDKAAEYARTKGTDPQTLVTARLAPDMYPLSTQVQLACHHAKDATARLTGATPLQIGDKEQTLDELKALIETTIQHLKSMSETAFDGTEDRRIEMPLMGTLMFESSGLQLLRDWSIPHFYFHVVTAYDILRHQGVELGKRDFMTHIRPHIRQHGDR